MAAIADKQEKQVQATDADRERNTVDMPDQGEMVLWHDTGRRQADPKIVMAIKNERRNMIRINTLNPVHGSVFIKNKHGVPHISDPRLENTDYAKSTGCWELTERGFESRSFAARLAVLESMAGVVVPKRSQVKQ